MAIVQHDGADRADIGTVGCATRSRMLMPPLVRLTDSEVELTDSVIPQASDGIEDGRGVLEKVSSCRLLIQQETLPPDLHIEPVHRNVQPGSQFGCAE